MNKGKSRSKTNKELAVIKRIPKGCCQRKIKGATHVLESVVRIIMLNAIQAVVTFIEIFCKILSDCILNGVFLIFLIVVSISFMIFL